MSNTPVLNYRTYVLGASTPHCPHENPILLCYNSPMYSISTKLGSALLVSIFPFFLVSITFSYQELNRTYSTIVSIAARSQLAQLSGSGSGLVAHYTFDEGSGITAGDSAGSNTGTLVNGPTWVTGKIGGGLTFDGTDDYVVRSIGDSATLLYKDGNV